MKVVGEESWSWMLFDDDGVLVLSVVCGGVGVYDIAFQLNDSESGQVRADGFEAAAALAQAVRADVENYFARHLADFDRRADVAAATTDWRSASHGRSAGILV